MVSCVCVYIYTLGRGDNSTKLGSYFLFGLAFHNTTKSQSCIHRNSLSWCSLIAQYDQTLITIQLDDVLL